MGIDQQHVDRHGARTGGENLLHDIGDLAACGRKGVDPGQRPVVEGHDGDRVRRRQRPADGKPKVEQPTLQRRADAFSRAGMPRGDRERAQENGDGRDQPEASRWTPYRHQAGPRSRAKRSMRA